MSKELAIEVKGLSLSYDRKRVLSNIFLKIEYGSICGLIGPNGAGKSSLFKALLGLIDYTAGSVSILGSDIKKVRTKVAYVPQKDEVDWHFPATVRDIVMMGRYPYKRIFQRLDKNDELIMMRSLEELGIVDLADRQIGALSGGQQQRVFIARAICQDPEIFLMDEPFVGVDITTEHKIVEIMKKKASEGKTVLVVHHDLSSVEEYFDKVILLNQRLICYGKVSEVFTRENISLTYAPQLKILHDVGLIDNQY